MQADAPLRNLAGYRLKRAFAVIQADLARVLEPFGLRMIPFSALLVVSRSPGLGQGHLAAALAVERSNLVAPLDGLVRQGLVRREPVPGDRRAMALVATEAGQALADAALEAVQAHESRLLSGVTASDLAAVMRVCDMIEAAAERAAIRGEAAE